MKKLSSLRSGNFILFLKTSLGYVSQIALKNMLLLARILYVQLQNSIFRSIFKGFQQLNLDLKILVGICFIKIKEILKINQKTFVLLLIKRRYFSLGYLVAIDDYDKDGEPEVI